MCKRARRPRLSAAVFLCCALPLAAQEQKILTMGNPGPYKMIERSDWSRYDNGKYAGLVSREVRAFINPEREEQGALWYRGNFYVLEETRMRRQPVAQGLDAVVPVNFRLSGKGDLFIEEDQGFPSLRGFPAFPKEAVKTGARWTAQGVRAVDPLHQGKIVLTPLVAEYEYQGVEDYKDTPVHRIAAKYASRHRCSDFEIKAGNFSSLQGVHDVTILIRVSDGLPLLIRDNLDETYTWADGSTVRFRGFTLIFGENTLPLNRGTMIANLRQTLTRPGGSSGGAPGGPGGSSGPAAAIAGGAGGPGKTERPGPGSGGLEGLSSGGGTGTAPADGGIELAQVPEGIKLTIRDIRFVADSDEFLAAERPRLDRIAEALKDISGRTFLVEGHTAAAGDPSTDMDLSLRRAKRMIQELVKRGVRDDQFIYKGWGSSKPVAPNADEAGRRQNRRVEITILE